MPNAATTAARSFELRALMFDDDASSLEPAEDVITKIGFTPVIKETLTELEDVIRGSNQATWIFPDDEPEEERPYGLLVVDEHHPNIKYFGTDAGDIDTDNGELAGFKIWQHLIQAEDSRLRDIPTIIISEHEIPKRVQTRVESWRIENKKPIWFHAKPSERTKAAFAEFLLNEVVQYVPNLPPQRPRLDICTPQLSNDEETDEKLLLRTFFRLMDRWRIDDRTAGLLLGLHHDGLEEKVAHLRSGKLHLPSRDSLDRIDILFEMGALVHQMLGGDVQEQLGWLQKPLQSAGNRSILTVLAGGGAWKFEDLLEARQVVRIIAGQAA